MLVNPLSDAIRFDRPGSDVTVRVVPFDAAMVAFSVTGEGPCIPREWEDKVFDKFTQIEARKAGGVVGSGQGQ